MVKVKICGITRAEDALHAASIGVDALGFNFYPKSKRFISINSAQAMVRQLPASIWKVGVFVNPTYDEVVKTGREVGLDTLQFHGEETPEFVAKFSSYRRIKAIRVGDSNVSEEISAWLKIVDYVLLDALAQNQYGGTGREIDAKALSLTIDKNLWSKIFLAGGLTPENVRAKVKQFAPFGVDTASGVETSPGVKGPALVERFLQAAKSRAE